MRALMLLLLALTTPGCVVSSGAKVLVCDGGSMLVPVPGFTCATDGWLHCRCWREKAGRA
jgi:hypothetical protein